MMVWTSKRDLLPLTAKIFPAWSSLVLSPLLSISAANMRWLLLAHRSIRISVMACLDLAQSHSSLAGKQGQHSIIGIN